MSKRSQERQHEKKVLAKLNKVLALKKLVIKTRRFDDAVKIKTWDKRFADNCSFEWDSLHDFLRGTRKSYQMSVFMAVGDWCKHTDFSCVDPLNCSVPINGLIAKSFLDLGLLSLASCKSPEEMLFRLEVMFPDV